MAPSNIIFIRVACEELAPRGQYTSGSLSDERPLAFNLDGGCAYELNRGDQINQWIRVRGGANLKTLKQYQRDYARHTGTGAPDQDSDELDRAGKDCGETG